MLRRSRAVRVCPPWTLQALGPLLEGTEITLTMTRIMTNNKVRQAKAVVVISCYHVITPRLISISESRGSNGLPAYLLPGASVQQSPNSLEVQVSAMSYERKCGLGIACRPRSGSMAEAGSGQTGSGSGSYETGHAGAAESRWTLPRGGACGSVLQSAEGKGRGGDPPGVVWALCDDKHFRTPTKSYHL